MEKRDSMRFVKGDWVQRVVPPEVAGSGLLRSHSLPVRFDAYVAHNAATLELARVEGYKTLPELARLEDGWIVAVTTLVPYDEKDK